MISNGTRKEPLTLTLHSINPYVRTTQRQKFTDPRYRRYHAWKTETRYMANAAGFPDVLDPKQSYSLSVQVFWKGKARADADNILKACLDALFNQDRRVMNLEVRTVENYKKDELRIAFGVQ